MSRNLEPQLSQWQQLGGPTETYIRPAQRPPLSMLEWWIDRKQVLRTTNGTGPSIAISSCGLRATVTNMTNPPPDLSAMDPLDSLYQATN